MQQSDAQLIQQVLHGNQEAFSPLVKKYQKGVHALAWRKIGDFHIAQEITQDAFLKAYQKLRTLKNHNAFSGWLYVIVANLCLDWCRKNRISMESLDTADSSEVDKVSYSQYVAERQEEEADETRREVVKELLKKLPESERTVMTLHYLGEMTIKAISEFLGVSQNTVKSRLSRARNRLRKEEDVLQQNLGSFKLPDNLADNIMQEVSRLAPVPPAASKPVAPLAASAASAVLIFLMMGVGAQYLSRFQKPYNLSATSEPTVELIDAVFVVDSPAKPAVRNQPGSSDTPGKSPGAGQKPDESLFAALPVDTTEVSTLKPQWTQAKGPEGGLVNGFFMTSNGDSYMAAGANLYRLTGDRSRWGLVNTDMPDNGSLLQFHNGWGLANDFEVPLMPWRMTERNDTLYVVSDSDKKILASIDRGVTWKAIGVRPEGNVASGLVITDEAFYLGVDGRRFGIDGGVFYSVDAGKSWTPLKYPLRESLRGITAIENTVFVGTEKGLYRYSSEGWERLFVGKTLNVSALASTEHRLYVVVRQEVNKNKYLLLYRSIDLGDSWEVIDFIKTVSDGPNNSKMDDDSGTVNTFVVKIVAAQEKLLVFNSGNTYYSSDAGETWISLDSGIEDTPSFGISDPNASPTQKWMAQQTLALGISDPNTFYRGGLFGIQRTTDAGKTWHPFNTGFVRTIVENLVYVRNALYAKIWGELVVSFDNGESWAPVLRFPDLFTSMMKFNDVLYVQVAKEPFLQLYSVSAEDNGVTPVPGMPSLDVRNAFTEPTQDKLQEFDMDRTIRDVFLKIIQIYAGSFAVSGNTYYIQCNQQLFRWKPGMTEWLKTGLADAGVSIDSITDIEEQGLLDFKIAVSDKTVYVGKQDGHLVQSFDEGDTWNDVTADLPFSVTQFKAIAFAGPTLYVATDKGVTYSSDGIRWHTATDVEGTPPVIEEMAVDGTTVYGATRQQVYQLKENSGTWKRVTPEGLTAIFSIAVDGNTIYVGTMDRGVLHFTIDEAD